MTPPENDKNTTKIHIALSPWDLTDDYNRHAGATLLSILDHCSQPVVTHLLYDEKLCVGKEKETEYNKACYQKIADDYGCELHFYHVEIPTWINKLDCVKIFTPGSFERIYLPELLPDIDKVIYFDCDMIINTDVSTLWNLKLNNTPFAACYDTRTKNIDELNKKTRVTYSKAGIDSSKCLNAGMLVLNLKMLRELDKPFPEIALTFLRENPNVPYFDQDFLNWFCQGNYTHADEIFNIYADRKNVEQFIDNCIIHYAGRGLKPWNSYHGKIDDYYWDYLMKTPWCEDRQTFNSYLRSAPDFSKCLPMLENNFFAHIEGTRKQKTRYAVHFVFCIIKSFIRGLRKAVTNK